MTGKLFAMARSQSALGSYQLELRARAGQAARTAQLEVSAVEVWLRAPQRPGQGPGYLLVITQIFSLLRRRRSGD